MVTVYKITIRLSKKPIITTSNRYLEINKSNNAYKTSKQQVNYIVKKSVCLPASKQTVNNRATEKLNNCSVLIKYLPETIPVFEHLPDIGFKK